MDEVAAITIEEYSQNAIKTESTAHTLPCDPRILRRVLTDEITLGAITDKLKRHLYYGGMHRQANLVEALNLGGLVDIDPDAPPAPHQIDPRLLHGYIGIMSEVGEMAEELLACLDDGRVVSVVNLAEEVGDMMWYLNLLVLASGLSWDQILRSNNEKLKIRYRKTFTSEEAAQRDIAAEQASLAKHVG